MGVVERQISDWVNVDVEVLVVDVVVEEVEVNVVVEVVVMDTGVTLLSVTMSAVTQVPWSEGQNSPTQMSAQPLCVS